MHSGHSPTPTDERTLRRIVVYLGELCLFAIIYALAAGPGWLVLEAGVTPLWPAAGVAVGWMYIRGWQLWPGVAIGSILVDRLLGNALMSGALAAAVANVSEATMAVALLRRVPGFDAALTRPRDMVVFVMLGGVMATFAGAVCGTTLLLVAGIVPEVRYWRALTQWWVGDAMGVIIVAALILSWWPTVVRTRRAMRRQVPIPDLAAFSAPRIFETVALAAAVMLASAIAFRHEPATMMSSAREYLPVPVVMWAAMRFGVRGATAASALVSLIGLSITVGSPVGSDAAHLALFQTALAVITGTALSAGAAIEDRSLQARAVAASEAKYRLLYNHAPVLLHSADRDGRIVSVSDYWLSTLGYERRDILGRDTVSFLHDDSRGAFDALWWQLVEEREAPGATEVQLVRRSGEVLDTLVSATVERDDEGAFARALVVFVDVTERKRTEAERVRFEGQLRERQRLESIGLLAGGVAHDFNNLLTTVLGNVDLARLSKPQELDTFLDRIESASTRAAALCQQLLAYAGRGRVSIGAVPVNRLVEDTVGLVAVTVSKRATIAVELDPAVTSIVGDASQVQQIVLNLLLNAAEALGEREGTVRVRTAMVDTPGTGADARPPHVLVEVADTGSGMTDDVRARIFEPFFTTKFAGRGLGLAAVQGIVRSHQGWLDVDTTPGAGSTFRVYLPASTVAAGAQPTGGPPAPALFNGAALIVDDEVDVRQVGAQCLQVLGFDVIEAGAGQAALALLEGGLAPAIVFLDMTMPGLSGQETFDRVHAAHPTLPVVMMSGYAEHEVLNQFTGGGPAAFLQKPFNVDALRAAALRALEAPPQRASASA